MPTRKTSLVISCVFLLSACASYSGIQSTGADSYFVSRQAATGFHGLGSMRADLYAEGAHHCAQQGKEFRLLKSEETKPPYILGNYPRVEIHFACLAGASPAKHRKADSEVF